MLPYDKSLIQEIESHRPRIPVGLLSRGEKDRLIERSFLGLYRWYINRSQSQRNWNPDSDIPWKEIRQDHNEEINKILEGFFAVEQYVPDYVENIVNLVRGSHGRSHFQIRWGSEEAKHADLWHNACLFSRFRSPDWLRNYMGELRSNQWTLPWEGDPIRMIFYTVFQERATQINYLNLGVHPDDRIDWPWLAAQPVLKETEYVVHIRLPRPFTLKVDGRKRLGILLQ